MKYDDIWGWFDYADLYRAAFHHTPVNGRMVEVGCFLGRSTAYLAQLVKDIPEKAVKLFAVDNWAGAPLDRMDQQYKTFIAEGKSGFDRFVENMIACEVLAHVTPLQLPSVEGAKQFEDKSLDFCFIDADHSYESVCEDIRAWFPKMKSGSWLAGHDYDRNEVGRAVHETLNEIGDLLNLANIAGVPEFRPQTCWLYEVP